MVLEARRVPPGSPDPMFRSSSPFGKMPALLHGDFRISDSSAIVAYLEALEPARPLIPTNPSSRARAIWFDEFADTLLFDCIRTLFFNRVVSPVTFGRPGDDVAAAAAEAEQLPALLDYVETQLTGSGFLLDNRVTLADIAVASPFVNLAHSGVTLDDRPRLKTYLDAILARPSFAPWVERETAFLASWRRGEAKSYSHPASTDP